MFYTYSLCGYCLLLSYHASVKDSYVDARINLGSQHATASSFRDCFSQRQSVCPKVNLFLDQYTSLTTLSPTLKWHSNSTDPMLSLKASLHLYLAWHLSLPRASPYASLHTVTLEVFLNKISTCKPPTSIKCPSFSSTQTKIKNDKNMNIGIARKFLLRESSGDTQT